MKKVFTDYMNNNLSLEKWQKIGVLCLIIIFAGLFGWIYEFIFYFFDGGMKEFYFQGGNFLPWINIYAYGALLIFLSTFKWKKNPLLVILLSALVCGLLEYFSGLIIYHLFDGLRLWDYNVEILNFGNIGGFVCFRSVAFFGISGLFFMYVVLPFCIFISTIMNKKNFLVLSITLVSIILIDEVYNLIVARVFDLPRAYDIYSKLGVKY